ncbi:MAG: phosphonate ABC transporter ATP-binding protein [Caldilineaceae bacterium]
MHLSIQQVSKRYANGVQALNGVTLAVETGESVVLLGANGSGKSTLLRCIVGLERPTAGAIHVGAVESSRAAGRELRQVRRQVGFIFQRFHLVGNLSVFQNVLHGALGRSRGPWDWFAATASATERANAMHCLERVGLVDLACRRADTLSGGQQQRLAIARTLMQEPKVILADEPVASLDPKAGREVLDLLWGISQEQGLTLVCALHQIELALIYGKRFVALKEGALIFDQPAMGVTHTELTQLYQQPAASLQEAVVA